MDSFYADGMFVQSCEMMEVGSTKSVIEHYKAGMGCFGRNQLRKQVVVGYYSGTTMHINHYTDKKFERRYQEHSMSVSVNELQTYAVNISDDAKHCNGNSFHAWIGPAKFSQFFCINDRLYLKGKKTTQMVREENKRKESVEFVQTIVSESSSHLKRRDAMCDLSINEHCVRSSALCSLRDWLPVYVHISTKSEIIIKEKKR